MAYRQFVIQFGLIVKLVKFVFQDLGKDIQRFVSYGGWIQKIMQIWGLNGYLWIDNKKQLVGKEEDKGGNIKREILL